MILDGSLAPEKKMPSERQLAARLGVSRAIVREALHELHGRGMIETRHGKGSFVACVVPPVEESSPLMLAFSDNARTLYDLFEVREQLEGQAAALAAEPARLASGDPFSLQKHSYVARSRYLEQLQRYDALFPAEQLLVLRSEDLFNNTETIWTQLQNFLGLAHEPLPMTLPRANAGRGEAEAVPDAIRDDLRTALRPTAAGVRARYGFGWDWA